jgi:hypothetical protein
VQPRPKRGQVSRVVLSLEGKTNAEATAASNTPIDFAQVSAFIQENFGGMHHHHNHHLHHNHSHSIADGEEEDDDGDGEDGEGGHGTKGGGGVTVEHVGQYVTQHKSSLNVLFSW